MYSATELFIALYVSRHIAANVPLNGCLVYFCLYMFSFEQCLYFSNTQILSIINHELSNCLFIEV